MIESLLVLHLLLMSPAHFLRLPPLRSVSCKSSPAELSARIGRPSLAGARTPARTCTSSKKGKQIIPVQENCFVWFTLVGSFSLCVSLSSLLVSPLSHQQMGYFNEISLACSHLCEK